VNKVDRPKELCWVELCFWNWSASVTHTQVLMLQLMLDTRRQEKYGNILHSWK